LGIWKGSCTTSAPILSSLGQNRRRQRGQQNFPESSVRWNKVTPRSLPEGPQGALKEPLGMTSFAFAGLFQAVYIWNVLNSSGESQKILLSFPLRDLC